MDRLPCRLCVALYLSPTSGWMFGGLYPCRGKRFFFSSGCPDLLWGLLIFRGNEVHDGGKAARV